jgi:hypothetical protein
MGKTSLDEQIANALINNAVNDGFLISVNDWAETGVNRSRNIPEITKAMFSTHMDTLTLNVEEKRVGMITLIYDNGSSGLDVFGGHTDVPHINRLVAHTLKDVEPPCTPTCRGWMTPLSAIQRAKRAIASGTVASWREIESPSWGSRSKASSRSG